MTKDQRKNRSGEAGASAPAALIPNDSFPVVGIGASAGGLEALELFLDNMPADSGMAFVVVQHMDPNHKGALPELLQRRTKMKVLEVEDGMRIRPNQVYVIPPNRDLTIRQGALRLLEPSEPRGLRLPIDSFFRSLAEDLQERAVAVVLSGMGADGTLGLRAIKEKVGLTLVQDPASAKFGSMPRSAIDAGVADFVASAERLPAKLIASLKGINAVQVEEGELEEKSHSGLDKVVSMLRDRAGRDFTPYKKSTIYRRVERRMGIHQFGRIAQYVEFLQGNPQELTLLSKELLIGVTSFFRDPAAFEALREKGLPLILAGRAPGQDIRVWVTACSTGEEAYSIAMLLKEAVADSGTRIQIFATDLDPEAIARARRGVYPESIAADVSPERLRRFFVKDGDSYRVAKELRDTVVFAPHNLLTDPPFTKLDLLSCRNLLIYLNPEQQKKVLPLLHYSLNKGGLLFLGSAETAEGFPELFTTVDSKQKLYRTRQTKASANLDFPSSFIPTETEGPGAPAPQGAEGSNLQEMVEALLLREFVLPSVLVNELGDILYIHGRTGNYLEPAAGKANLNIFAMAREGLRDELWGTLRKAHLQGEKVSSRGMRVMANSGLKFVAVTVKPLKEPSALSGLFLVLFEETSPIPRRKRRGKADAPESAEQNEKIELLSQEVEQGRERLQTTREEMQTSQEELKSANEELQSTNEELQSTNEELTTSKEEMQSLNEELISVNAEMQAKIEELSRTGNDMKNLLNSTDIATLFLDNDLNVRRFTTATARIIKLIQSDVGRPVTDIVSDLDYPSLAEDVREVLETLVFKELETLTKDGRWYQVKIMPYRTFENRIDGAVITFTEITKAKNLEKALREAERTATRLLQAADEKPIPKGSP